jgi:hypothetical protein
VVVCGGAEDELTCGEESGDDSNENFSRLTDFLLELIACGIRNLTLLCCGDCRGVCREVHQASSSAPLQSSSSPSWLYSHSNLRHLSAYLSFRSISSKAEFEKDLQVSLEETLRFSQQRGGEEETPFPSVVPVFLSSVRYSPRGQQGAAEGSEKPSSRAVYEMLKGESEGGTVRGGLTVSCRILTLTDPAKDAATFSSFLLR